MVVIMGWDVWLRHEDGALTHDISALIIKEVVNTNFVPPDTQ